jgi:hypothetical protein
MSTREKLIKAWMGMLALAEELQNVSVACKRAGDQPQRDQGSLREVRPRRPGASGPAPIAHAEVV